jgi:hypothetical protein
MPFSLGFVWEREKMASLARGHQPHHLVHRERTGYFPGSGPTHAVTNQVNAVLNGIAERILVGGALAALV